MVSKDLVVNIFFCLFVILYLALFIYSGVNKIKNFSAGSKGLQKKLGVSSGLAKFGFGSVIFLELVLSIVVILFFLTVPFLKESGKISEKVANDLTYVAISIVCLFIIFMVAVTILYHPPKDGMSTFLTKLSFIGGFGLILVYLLKSIIDE